MASADAAITARGLHKRYGRHVALASLDLVVEPGQVVGLLGPNGAGKTTTVKILTGLVRPTGGTAELFGVPVADPPARSRLGYLPEHFRFPEWLTGLELLRFHARLAGRDPRRDADWLHELLALVGLDGRGDERIRGYSKGMTQRLGLAQALVGAPDLVLLDEPTSAMDPLGRREIRELIRTLARDGVAVLLNSHLLSEVELVCDHVVVIDRGTVLRSGTLDEVRSASLEVRIELERVDQRARDLVAGYGRIIATDDHEILLGTDDPDVVPRLAADLVQSGARVRALVPLRRSLEDAFVGLVRKEES
ncbi:MAG: ABC transporter ATP-binding protein [Actinobacteria bacterium]|nr:ABC transporter ATP-binding protein [Actinomycetota bacterium]